MTAHDRRPLLSWEADGSSAKAARHPRRRLRVPQPASTRNPGKGNEKGGVERGIGFTARDSGAAVDSPTCSTSTRRRCAGATTSRGGAGQLARARSSRRCRSLGLGSQDDKPRTASRIAAAQREDNELVHPSRTGENWTTASGTATVDRYWRDPSAVCTSRAQVATWALTLSIRRPELSERDPTAPPLLELRRSTRSPWRPLISGPDPGT